MVILLVIVGLFLRVMADFLLPLFLALLLAVMFGPLYRWFRDRWGQRSRGPVTTGSIMLMVLIPLLLLLIEAGREAQSLYRAAMDSSAPADRPAPRAETRRHGRIRRHGGDGRLGHRQDCRRSPVASASSWNPKMREQHRRRRPRVGGPQAPADHPIPRRDARRPVVMGLATYYFFADGPAMVRGSCG